MALTKKNIKVIFEETIKPSCPTPNHLRYLAASLFDHLHTTTTLTPLIFFYTQKYNTKNFGTNEILDRLKRSFPNTLSVFFPLAGRVHQANHFICNDEGVPYVQAMVDKPLMDVVNKAQASELDELLTPYGQRGHTNLILAIQVNAFACGGLAIGIQLNHTIFSVFGISMFVNAWASIANGKDPLTLVPHPNFMNKLFPSPPLQADQNLNMISDRHVTKWFVFNEAILNSLRFKLYPYHNNTDSTTNHRPSPPSLIKVLSAFICSRVKIASHHNTNDIQHPISQVLTTQPRSPPDVVQSYYFGNNIATAITKLPIVLNDDNYFSNESFMGEFLELTKESIARTSNNGFIRKMQEGKEDLSYIAEYLERENKREIVPFGFNNLRNLPHEYDFGWGNPVRVTFATLMYKNSVVFTPPSASCKDVVAYINLSREDMAKLEADAVFNSFLCKALSVKSKL